MDSFEMDMIKQDAALTLLQSANADAKRELGNLKAGKGVQNEKQIDEAAKEFESVFLASMLKPMFESVEIDKTFGGGKGEEVFRGFMVQEYGKMISDQGGVGIAKHVKEELMRIQEEANNVSSF
jgi:Rod binding domain-containing protein